MSARHRVYDAGCDVAGWAMAAGTWVTAFATLPAGLAMAAVVRTTVQIPIKLAKGNA